MLSLQGDVMEPCVISPAKMVRARVRMYYRNGIINEDSVIIIPLPLPLYPSLHSTLNTVTLPLQHMYCTPILVWECSRQCQGTKQQLKTLTHLWLKKEDKKKLLSVD